jgi:hypothetical protein
MDAISNSSEKMQVFDVVDLIQKAL